MGDEHEAVDRNHEFSVGGFECAVVSDGSFSYPAPDRLFFANADRDDLARALRRTGIELESWETYVSPFPSLLIRTDEETVLVDTGGGAVGDHTGKLHRNLERVGTPPAKIDTVLLSHIHPDHVGGNLDAAAAPAFPNATYAVSRTEAAFWLNDPDLSSLGVPQHIKEAMIAAADQQVRPLGDRLERIDDETALASGVRTLPAPGHTPGHLVVEVTSGGATFLYLADLVLLPLHVERPEWYAAVDIDPAQLVESRRRLLARAADRSALVMAQHFPAPGLGHIRTTATGYAWVPISGSGA